MHPIVSPDGLAAMHPCAILATGSFQRNTFIATSVYTVMNLYMPGIKGQYAFNVHANYSMYTAINDRLSDIAIGLCI